MPFHDTSAVASTIRADPLLHVAALAAYERSVDLNIGLLLQPLTVIEGAVAASRLEKRRRLAKMT